MTFARSADGASVEPRFARRDGLASLRRPEPRFARLEASENGTPSGEPSGGLYRRTGATHRSCSPERRTDPPLKFSGLLVVWFHQKGKNILGNDARSYTVFVFWCNRGLVCWCLKPFTPNRKYGAEFPERSENRFRYSVDFRKTTDFREIRVSEKVLIPGL